MQYKTFVENNSDHIVDIRLYGKPQMITPQKSISQESIMS